MFFGYFPPLLYNQNFRQKTFNNEIATDIFYRTKFREITKNENVSYYYYTVKDGETPEQLAFRYFGHPLDYWILMYANDIVDPFYDWPMSNKNFNEFIKDKYGSIEYAQTTVHHYEKIVQTTDSKTGEISRRILEIDYEDARTNKGEELPLDDFVSLAVDYYPNIPGTFRDGSSATMVISRDSQTIYDWEYDRNEAKRNIKVVKKEYIPSIKREMERFAEERNRFSYMREIRGY